MMDRENSGGKNIFLALLILLFAGTLIFTGCSGGGGSTSTTTPSSGTTGGDTSSGDTSGSTAAKATVGGTLLSSSTTGTGSLFKRLGKTAAATSGIPVSGATVLCFDLDSVSTAAAGTTNTDSNGQWTMELDPGNYMCFGVYIDLASLTIKTARIEDVEARPGETTDVGAATVEADTTSPTIVSVLSDNVADTSLSDGDPDPLYEITDVLPNQALAIVFSEAMNVNTMNPGTGAVLKDSSGNTVDMTVKFNGTATEFRYIPSSPLTPGETYTLEITNKAKDLSNNGMNDPDSDGVVAIAKITVTEQAEAFSFLSATPKDGATSVSVYKDITVTFNRPVDFVSFKENTTITPSVSGRLEPSGDGVTFFHSLPFDANTEYTITIGADVADLAGNTLGTAQTITFTTGAGVDDSAVSGFDPGGGTAEDLKTIVANITKAELALDNQDLVTFATYFAPKFTLTEPECEFSPDLGQEICNTVTMNLDAFLKMLKDDLIEMRNMSKGFGEVQRVMLTNATGSQMSVEHFNSDFDADRNPAGVDLYVGWPNRRQGVDFVDSEIEVPDPMSPGGTRMEFATYRLSGDCRDVTGPDDQPGAGEILASYRMWDPQKQREEMVTRICPVYDGDADSTNSWESDNEIYPADWNGPRNVWEDNDNDCQNGGFDCFNEDGIISFKDTDGDGVPDQAVRYYEVVDPDTSERTAVEEDITSDLQAAGGIDVASAMSLAASNGWDIEGVDNDGDTRIITWDNDGDGVPDGGFIDRRINEDWPNGMDDDADGKIDEDHDGMNNDPWPQDGDNDPTNDPMPHSDWNLANSDNVVTTDEFWAQTFLVTDPTLAPDNAAQWTDDNGTVYYEIQGPKGWPYSYAAGADGIPWSGDEFDQYNDGTGTGIDGHIFAWADVSILGKVYFRNDDKSSDVFSDIDRDVYVDLTAAGFSINNGAIEDTSERVQDSEKASAIFRWDGNGNLANGNGVVINWEHVHPLMDSIDYNADGDSNINTQQAAGLRRVPHDRVTGGVMSDADYLALGWDTWKVSYDYQLISDPDVVWDVEADWARMEGDDDGDGLFNEDGLYAWFFNKDGSLKDATTTGDPNGNYMARDDNGDLYLYRVATGEKVYDFDISDGIDNDGDGQVDEVEPWDDDGDGVADEDPPGDPNDLNNNGNLLEPYDDDGDGRKDEDPVSYERDRIDDHSKWSAIFQQTTDAVVDTFYLEVSTDLNIIDVVIDETGLKATAIVDITDTERWIPHNPWGEDFDGDGVPDDEQVEKNTMVFNLEKISDKWLMTSIRSVDSPEEYATQVESGEIEQFGQEVPQITLVEPTGDPINGPATNAGTSPTLKWDDSNVQGTIGSYLIHIEEITETMVSEGGEPSSVMIIVLDPSEVSVDPTTGVKSVIVGSGGTDVTDTIITAFADDPYFPFDTGITALESGKVYGWGVLAFNMTPDELIASVTQGKPEPIGDSFEPMLFATAELPSFFTSTGGGTPSALARAIIGGVEYNPIPSNIAPSLYNKKTGRRHSHRPSSVDPRDRR